MNDDLGKIGATVTLNTKPYDDGIVHIDKTTRAVLGKLSGLAVSMFGLGAIKNFVEDAVKSYIKQEDAVNGLERALKRVGQGSYSKQLQQVAKDLQKLTIYGDEATMGVMALGVNMGISAKQMEDATRAAMGLAAGYKLDLNTAMQLVAKAAVGNTGLLGRYGIKLDQTKPKQEQFNELLKKGNDLFQLSGAQTFGQHLTQLGNAWGDLKEQVGAFIISLSGFDESMDSMKNQIVEFTEMIQDNCDQWAFEIKYVLSFFEAGLKNIYAMVEPVITYIVKLVTDAVVNIVRIGQWTFDNLDKLIDNFPKIIIALCKDILMLFVNLGETLVDLFKNTASAIWDAIWNGNTDGFSKILDDLKADWNRTMIEMGQFTSKVFEEAGITPFPEMQSTASIGEVVKKYANISDTFEKIDRERQEREADLEQNLIDRLNKKREQGENGTPIEADVAGNVKNNVVGSFSSAILAGMFGANSPEAQTAKNTKKMVDLQRDLNDSFDEAFTYG